MVSEPQTTRVAPFILAGGRSTRMGRDKAMICVGGKTLLARAVETLRLLPALGFKSRVTVVGDRTALEGADRSIADRFPGCGPLGGMEAALNDLDKTRAADWALFLPVDMPFLPSGLLNALLTEWTAAMQNGARVCLVVVDGRPQPLVSLVHRELHPILTRALQAGEFKVTPVLESAYRELAQTNAGALLHGHPIFFKTGIETDRPCRIDDGWLATEAEQRCRPMWFANLNSQNDLTTSETFFPDLGSISGQTLVSD